MVVITACGGPPAGLMRVASGVRDASLIIASLTLVVTAEDAVVQSARPLVGCSRAGRATHPQATCIDAADMTACAGPKPNAVASTIAIISRPVAVIVGVVIRPLRDHGASRPREDSRTALPDLATQSTRLSAGRLLEA